MVDHIKKHNYHYINALLILISVVVTGLEITLLIFVLISINVGFRAYQNIYATNQKFEKLDNQFKYLKEVSSLDTERLKARYDKLPTNLEELSKEEVYLATRYNATIGNDTETIILATKLKSFDEVYFKSSAIIFLAFTYNKICEYSKSLNILEEAKVFDRDYIFFHPDLYIANLMKLGLYNKMVSTYFYDYHKLSVENRLCFIQSLYETETGSKAEIKELLTDLYENNLELLLEGDNLHFYRSLIVRFPNN